MAAYKYQKYRAEDKKKPVPELHLAPGSSDAAAWQLGKLLADNQNWARSLSETCANRLTPRIFAEEVRQNMHASVQVVVHDRKWAEDQKMGSFLSVSNGSREPPVFLELTYDGKAGKEANPICLVGKGITFDSGGISLKPSRDMDLMRGDMTGGAIVVSVMNALAASKSPVYVKAFVPLTENLPGGSATKPGDVVTARSGKTICVDNTDAEGRLILV